MTEQIILTASNVSLRYRTRTRMFKWFEHSALDKVSFDIYRGETLGVLGRNGCGKSSLLRILAGIINPTDGVISCEVGVKRALLSLGLGFRPDLSGRNNALLSAMLGGMTKQQANSCLNEINEFAELGDFFYQPVKTYSAGMRARLGFATAVKLDVDIMLIDEVLSVGDEHFRHKAQNYMTEKIGSRQTVVFVSHNPRQVDELCDRAMWLKDGKVESIGETQAVADKYKEYIKEIDDLTKINRQIGKMSL